MNPLKPLILALAVVGASVQAQPATPSAAPSNDAAATAPTPAPAERTVDGLRYRSGGVGLGESRAMQSLAGDYPLQITFSGAKGEYLLAKTFTIQGPDGRSHTLNDVGPHLLLALAPGRYTMTANFDGLEQRRQVQVGPKRRVHWQVGQGASSK